MRLRAPVIAIALVNAPNPPLFAEPAWAGNTSDPPIPEDTVAQMNRIAHWIANQETLNFLGSNRSLHEKLPVAEVVLDMGLKSPNIAAGGLLDDWEFVIDHAI
jgi:hypothetical protein